MVEKVNIKGILHYVSCSFGLDYGIPYGTYSGDRTKDNTLVHMVCTISALIYY